MKLSIVKRYKIFFAITITFLIIGIGSMLFKGFNLGIDFTGGSIMDLEFKNPVTVSQVREVLKEKNLGNAIIQLESSDSNAKSSKGVLMIAYITIRFEFRFALAAIVALIIDVMVTLSYFSLFHMELDSSFVAALLTVVGYSVNGTIVIFDRIRENLKIHRRSESMTEMVDNSIWQTMGRSIYTVGTSLFAVVAIFIWGGETIRNFSFAMLVGFSSGAYTSTFLAGPLWMMLRKLKPGRD